MSSRTLLTVWGAVLGLLPLPTHAHAQWSPDGLGVCTEMGAQGNPQLALDGEGGLFVAWTDERAGNLDVYLQHITSSGLVMDGWPAGGMGICPAAGNQHGPILAADGAGGVVIGWTDDTIPNHRIRVLRITASGAHSPGWPECGLLIGVTYEADEEISQIGLAADGAGGAYILWSLLDGYV